MDILCNNILHQIDNCHFPPGLGSSKLQSLTIAIIHAYTWPASSRRDSKISCYTFELVTAVSLKSCSIFEMCKLLALVRLWVVLPHSDMISSAEEPK